MDAVSGDPPYEHYHEHMAAREFEQAADVMRAARDLARAHDRRDDAALCGTLMATALTVAGELQAPEAAYQGAETDDPDNPLLKLQFADFLLDALNQPERALQNLEVAIPDLRANRSTSHAAGSSLGSIYVALGRMEDAARTFRGLIRPEALPGSEPRAYDSRLVTALVAHGTMLDECREYAEQVLRLASSQEDDDTVAVARGLIADVRRAQDKIR